MGSHTEEFKGRVKEATGAITGNDELEREGERDQASAAVKRRIDDVRDSVDDTVDAVKERLDRH